MMPAKWQTSFECCNTFWAVGRTVVQAAQQSHDFRMQAVHIHFKAGLLADLLDRALDFLVHPYPAHHLFDAGRVNPAILDQALERDTRHFAPYRVQSPTG